MSTETIRLIRDGVETVTRGHKYKLKKLRCCTSLHPKKTAFRVMDSWNSLPSDVVDAPSLQAFKSRLDEIWQNKKFLH